ncbi:hypothetical protein EVAR_70130_1 [Eumeta japonica]|uniref:Uncharacterized protein n=1 Tax=Eumeta variegata TaxID=151549 RepID=A0A4C1Z8U6_EUMVA|nr:hypothetical protein EVAR_70130_1 [Eumeta japonica]
MHLVREKSYDPSLAPLPHLAPSAAGGALAAHAASHWVILLNTVKFVATDIKISSSNLSRKSIPGSSTPQVPFFIIDQIAFITLLLFAILPLPHRQPRRTYAIHVDRSNIVVRERQLVSLKNLNLEKCKRTNIEYERRKRQSLWFLLDIGP